MCVCIYYKCGCNETAPRIEHFSGFHSLQRLLLLLLCVLLKVCVYQVHLIGCCVSESKGHLCLYRNVWPEVFIVVLQELHTCIIRVRGCYHVAKFHTFQFLR